MAAAGPIEANTETQPIFIFSSYKLYYLSPPRVTQHTRLTVGLPLQGNTTHTTDRYESSLFLSLSLSISQGLRGSTFSSFFSQHTRLTVTRVEAAAGPIEGDRLSIQ